MGGAQRTYSIKHLTLKIEANIQNQDLSDYHLGKLQQV